MNKNLLLFILPFMYLNSWSQEYCDVNESTYPCYANVIEFHFGEIHNSAFNALNGYYNYLDQSTTVSPGETLLMTVSFDRYSESSDPIIGGEIYIDWNIDGDFDDTNELIFSNLEIIAHDTFAFPVHVPDDAVIGASRIRTRTDDDYTNNGITPCGEAEETQDYSLLITASNELDTPSNINTNAISSTKIHLSWRDNSSMELNHIIYRSIDNINYAQIATLPANTVEYLDEYLDQGQKYFYKVLTETVSETSDYSNENFATTLTTDLTRITNGDFVQNSSGYGSFLGDFDNNSEVDILITSPRAQIYLNDDNSIDNSNLDFYGAGSASCADYDNDGDLDFYATSFNYSGGAPINLLYKNNNDGTFTPISPFIADGKVSNCIWGDINKDGKIDLFLSYLFPNNYGKLYINMGNDVFEEHLTIPNSSGHASFIDYDDDDDLDLFVANNSGYNYLFDNNDGVFSENNSTILSSIIEQSNGSSWGDIDNDGDLDLFLANGNNEEKKNSLYTNNGNGTFSQIITGSIVNEEVSSYGSAFTDFDNDGNLDLIVSNFFNQNSLYTGNGDGSFNKIIESPIMNEFVGSDRLETPSFGCAWGDFNQDGFSDLVITNTNTGNNFLYENSGNSNNWIKIKLIGETSNRSAIGAKVKVTTGTKTQYRYISSLTGFNGQNELTVIIGLGLSSIIDEIEIKWPQGEKVTFTNIAVNQEIEVSENDENLGIEESTVSSIYIYPNPFTEYLIVKNPTGEILNVKLYDLNGISLRDIETNKDQPRLNFRELSSGIYFLQINSSREARTYKIIKR